MSARATAPSAAPSTMIVCTSDGSAARTLSILATCSAVSQTMTVAPESLTTHWHSSGEFDG